MDIYSIVTEKIINLLESGVVPWRKPWTSAGVPRSAGRTCPSDRLSYTTLAEVFPRRAKVQPKSAADLCAEDLTPKSLALEITALPR